MHMFRHKFALMALVCAGLVGLAGCNSPDVDDQPSDFAQKQLEKHHENGEINDYQYQQSLKQFTPSDPNAQKPAPPPNSAPPASTTTTN